ncbi:MAG TPA: copper transporter [Clostridia bacterium]|nr:copper transporter [Clostridia bacterium]
MGVNIKYYIISIAAIFISLGIGIFIGFNMNGQEIYLKQHRILVDSLENRFVEFKREKENLEQNVQDLNTEREKLSVFVGNIFYEVVHNKLEGMNIAIIETTDRYFYDDINETLKLSGASIPVRVKYKDKIYKVTEEQLQEINDLTGKDLEKREDLVDFINNEIINSLISGDINYILGFLIDHEYIQCNYDFNESEDLNIDSVVVTGGNSKSQEHGAGQLNIGLIKNLQEQQFKIIGAERLDVEQSHIPAFKNLNISTVDNVDSRMGKISLIYLLEGARGHYGEKPTADSLAPFVVIDPSEE